MTDAQVVLRAARSSDLPAISEIYNRYVLESTCTYATEPETLAQRTNWFQGHGPKHPVFVAQRGDEIVGWASLSPFHSRCAYQHTVEDSIYIRHDCHRQGFGSALLEQLIVSGRSLGHHTIIALISADQKPSVALHEKHGFKEAANLREVGQKFGRWLDVVYLQLML